MPNEVANLLSDVEILEKSAQDEFKRKFWNGYTDRLNEYNLYLKRAKDIGLCNDLDFIPEVPPGEKAAFGTGSVAEQAKLKQVSNEAVRLASRLRASLSTEQTEKTTPPTLTPLALVEKICDRFQIVARQLRDRHANRSTLEIEDEYDVQDLLHALLKIDFDDVRPEEWTPSIVGSSARMDFLLKEQKIVIEAKKTRKGLGTKEVGDELLADIGRYTGHSDCKVLVCFVYDPETRIGNPRGLEADLERKSTSQLTIRAFVRPTGK